MFKNVLCCVVFSKIIRIFVAKTACNKRVPLLHALTDQLLTGSGWLHISWAPFTQPRHFVRIGYYK